MNRQEAELLCDVLGVMDKGDPETLLAKLLALKSILNSDQDRLCNVVKNYKVSNITDYVVGHEVYIGDDKYPLKSPSFTEATHNYTLKKPNMRVDPVKAIKGGAWGEEFKGLVGTPTGIREVVGKLIGIQQKWPIIENTIGNTFYCDELYFCDMASIKQEWLMEDS